MNTVCHIGAVFLCSAALCVGCSADRPSFNMLQEQCGDFSWDSLPVYHDVGANMGCAADIIDSVNFREKTFGYEVSSIDEAESTPGVVIGGLYALFLTDLVSVDYVLEDDESPELLRSIIEDYLDEELVDYSDPIGKLYFQMSVNELRKITADYSGDDFFMRQTLNTIKVNNLINGETDRHILSVSTISSAAMLAHELSHVHTQSKHTQECPNGEIECDIDHNDTYGISIYQVQLWFDVVSEQHYPGAICSEYYGAMKIFCSNIVNKNEACSNLEEYYSLECPRVYD